MIDAVDDVLVEVGAAENPRLLVLNKVDRLDDERRRELSLPPSGGRAGVGRDGGGARRAAPRRSRRSSCRASRRMELLVPYEEGSRLSELHDVAGDMEREDTPGGRARPRARAGRRGGPLRALLGERAARVRLEYRRLSETRSRARRARTKATRAWTCTPTRRRTSTRASARAWAPASRSRSPTVTPAWWCRAPGWRREHGITLVNTPGLIDAGYRGELRVLLLNTDRAEVVQGDAGRPDRAARAGEGRVAGAGRGGGAVGDGARRGRLRLDGRLGELRLELRPGSSGSSRCCTPCARARTGGGRARSLNSPAIVICGRRTIRVRRSSGISASQSSS